MKRITIHDYKTGQLIGNASKSPPIHKTPDGSFEYGWIRSPRDFVGKIEPFAQGWHVQYLGDGTSDFCASRRGVFDFVADFYDISDTPFPDWLKKELSKERVEEHNHEQSELKKEAA